MVESHDDFVALLFGPDWDRRSGKGKYYGRRYIRSFKTEFDDMFVPEMEHGRNIFNPGMMLENLRSKHPGRFDFTSATEILHHTLLLIAKYKKHNAISSKQGYG